MGKERGINRRSVFENEAFKGAFVHCRSATPYQTDIIIEGMSLGDTSRFQYFSLKRSGTLGGFCVFMR